MCFTLKRGQLLCWSYTNNIALLFHVNIQLFCLLLKKPNCENTKQLFPLFWFHETPVEDFTCTFCVNNGKQNIYYKADRYECMCRLVVKTTKNVHHISFWKICKWQAMRENATHSLVYCNNCKLLMIVNKT